MRIRNGKRALLVLAAGFAITTSAQGNSGQSETTQSAPGDDPNGSLIIASKALVEFCGHFDADDKDKLKARADACNTYSTAMKSTSDAIATTLAKGYERSRTKVLDSKSDATQESWGRFWQRVLWFVDAIAVLVAIVVLGYSSIGTEKVGLVREPSLPSGAKGKISYSRVIGLIGGLGSLAFVGLITNVCLSHLFSTGKMPDQLGTTYATGVGTFLTAIVPYIINQLNKVAPSA